MTAPVLSPTITPPTSPGARVAGTGSRVPVPVLAVLRRLGTALVVLWGAVTVTFCVMAFMPGDRVSSIVGGSAPVTPELRAQVEEQYGLNNPLLVQYVEYVVGLLRGDLGMSYALKMPVAEALGEQLGFTVQLLIASTVVALVVAVAVALLTAHRAHWLRSLVSSVETLFVAVPSFWLGIMLITVFSFGLRWLPAAGASGIQGLVLPSLALGLPIAATLSQVMRDGLEKTLDEPFVVAVRARGASETLVRLGHGIRHTLLPAVTLIGWMTGSLIGGSVIVEQVFSRSGIGRMMVYALESRDLPVVLGIVVVTAVFFVVINAVTDILYPLIDPRIRS